VTTEVIIALGSNLAYPAENLSKAIECLKMLFDAPVRASSYWQSEPINMEDHAAAFLNAVVLSRTDLKPVALLQKLEEIEMMMGRQKSGISKLAYSHSRTIDLDIIAYGNELIDSDFLTVPHPRAMQRLFVLLPLAQLCPEYCFPGQSSSLNDLIRKAPLMEINDLGQ
jgi:2-amino-4-hydroxy-6-hydroxymethyldihydropteridine diphosphokinase